MKEVLAHYETLKSRVGEKFSAVEAKYNGEFACKLGCHSCCKPGLTVSPIEAAAIQNFLKKNPENFAPFGKSRCAFLDQNGACSIYEARPLVCRSHGAPLQIRDEDSKTFVRDVCPLNFTGADLANVPAEDVLNLDTLNTLLATLNIQAFGKKKSGERVALTPEAISAFTY